MRYTGCEKQVVSWVCSPAPPLIVFCAPDMWSCSTKRRMILFMRRSGKGSPA